MRFEKVHSVRDYFDGVRSGTADFNGAPHYFECVFDVEADEYTKDFQLFPVTAEFMEREVRHWAIFRAWEAGFHHGIEPIETHPGNGHVDAVYDELSRWLNEQIPSLSPIAGKHRAAFRAIGGQEGLAPGIMRELEVCWTPVTGD